VKKLTILFNRAWFPASEGNKVGKAYVDWLKDNPQDKSVMKLLGIGVTSSEDGEVLVYGFDTIINGKEKEALEYTTKQDLFMATRVDSFKYKVEVILDFTEAYKIINMTAPQV
jgi:hypothetical protein